MVKKLTLEDRRKIEQMWKDNASPLKIAAELGISQCTVYTELKRGQETDERTGEMVLDHNFRPEYKAERGLSHWNDEGPLAGEKCSVWTLCCHYQTQRIELSGYRQVLS